MTRAIPAWTIAAVCAFAVSVGAQDTTVKSKTKIETDDAKMVTYTGCLQAGETAGTFVLANAVKGQMSAEASSEVNRTGEPETPDTPESPETPDTPDSPETPDEQAVGTAGSAAVKYQLTPQAGVNLTPHVGHKVQITALMVPAADGDDDAEVEMETETKVERDDAPDSKMKTKTEAEIARGSMAKLTVASVKHIAPSCQ